MPIDAWPVWSPGDERDDVASLPHGGDIMTPHRLGKIVFYHSYEAYLYKMSMASSSFFSKAVYLRTMCFYQVILLSQCFYQVILRWV